MRRYKRSIPKKLKVREYDFSGILTPLAMRVNKKINSLERKGYNKRSQAYTNLLSRLNNNKIRAIDKKGKVKLSKNIDRYTPAQKRALRNAMENFLKSQTSTKSGINEYDRNVRKGIKNLLGNRNITDKQVDIMANMFKNENFSKLADKVGGSDMLIITYDVVSKNKTKKDLIQSLKDYMIFDKANEKEIMSILDMFDDLTNA